MDYADALNTAVSLSGDEGALQDFLASMPAWRDTLETDVALIVGLSRESNLFDPTPDEHARVARRFRSMLMGDAAERDRASAWSLWRFLAWPRLAMTLAVIATAVVVALFSIGVRFNLGADGVHAVVVRGQIAEVSASALTIQTGGVRETVELDSTSMLFDGFGNPIDPSRLKPGRDVVLTVRQNGNSLVGERLELSGRLVGTAVSIDTSKLVLHGASADYVVQIIPSTEVDGQPKPGSRLEIQVTVLDDGRLVAQQIETADTEDEDSRPQDNGGGGGKDDQKEGIQTNAPSALSLSAVSGSATPPASLVLQASPQSTSQGDPLPGQQPGLKEADPPESTSISSSTSTSPATSSEPSSSQGSPVQTEDDQNVSVTPSSSPAPSSEAEDDATATAQPPADDGTWSKNSDSTTQGPNLTEGGDSEESDWGNQTPSSSDRHSDYERESDDSTSRSVEQAPTETQEDDSTSMTHHEDGEHHYGD
jgi:hypothetical protein